MIHLALSDLHYLNMNNEMVYFPDVLNFDYQSY